MTVDKATTNPVNHESYYYCENFSQLTFTCSKSTIGTLEKDVKYVQS